MLKISFDDRHLHKIERALDGTKKLAHCAFGDRTSGAESITFGCGLTVSCRSLINRNWVLCSIGSTGSSEKRYLVSRLTAISTSLKSDAQSKNAQKRLGMVSDQGALLTPTHVCSVWKQTQISTRLSERRDLHGALCDGLVASTILVLRTGSSVRDVTEVAMKYPSTTQAYAGRRWWPWSPAREPWLSVSRASLHG